MRAIYLLLALALARDSTASIFRHQVRPHTDGLIVQPLDYVDQYQQQAQQQTKTRHRRPDSSEETKERTNYDDVSDYASALRSADNWNSPPLAAVIPQGGETPYGDVIGWRGVEIAAGPKSPIKDKRDIERVFQDAYKTTQHVSKEVREKIHEAFEKAAANPKEDAQLNATQLAKKHGYAVEEHVAKTEDGYNLTLFRIKQKQESHESHESHESREEEKKEKRPAVLLMHGFLGSADDWLLRGPKKSLAYSLADAGHDVWLGNVRGSKYSRRHASKHESDPDFWHFSMDEIAQHDVPTMIHHALKKSQQKKLHYVGHSQGATVFFAWASTHPESKDKVAMMHALSPVVYMSNTRSPLIKMVAPSSHFYEDLQEHLGHGEFKPSKEVIQAVGGNMCEKDIGCKHVCSNLNFVATGVDTAGMEPEFLPVIAGHVPAGASARQIKHYGQSVSSHEFRKYDHGAEINKKIYGHHHPPKYNMTEVKVPVALYSSEEDWLAHPKDVEKLHKELPNVRESYKVPEKHFSHMDFQFSEKAPEEVHNKVIESIKKNKVQ